MYLQPKPYQDIAFRFALAHKRCNIWAVPGMGKTVVVYMVLDILHRLGSTMFPALVLAPLRVARTVWPAEAQKWAEFRYLRVVVITGTPSARRRALETPADVYVINYEVVTWLVDYYANARRPWPFRIVVADESTRLKNYRSRQGGVRARALSKISMSVGRWINLTGTPAPNGIADLWGQMWFVDAGERLGRSWSRFIERWFQADWSGYGWAPRPGATEEVQQIISDVSLSLRAEDWLSIDKPTHRRIEVALPTQARTTYAAMEKDFVAQLESGAITAFNAAAKYTKLLQLAAGAVYDDAGTARVVHGAKIEAVQELVEELSGEPVIIVYHYRHTLTQLRAAFPGAVELRDDLQVIARWNRGDIPVLLLHPASGGHGLNLQDGGRTMVFMSNTMDLEIRQQCIERIGPTRQAQAGHKRAVLLYDIVATKTIDEEVMDGLDRKGSVQDLLTRLVARRTAS